MASGRCPFDHFVFAACKIIRYRASSQTQGFLILKLPLRETLITSACICILCGLGTWQIKRLEWKEAMISGLQSAYDAGNAQAPLSATSLNALAQTEKPLLYGHLGLTLLRHNAIYVGPKTQDSKIGYHLVVPARIDTKSPTLFVNLGWVDEIAKTQKDFAEKNLPEKADLSGLIRKPDWSSFTSNNSPQNNLWFRTDINEIKTYLGFENVYPFVLYVDGTDASLNGVTLHEKGWLPRNNHRQYAIFWFSLAGVLCMIYALYVRSLNAKKTPR